MKICKKPFIKNKTELVDSMKVETLNEKPTIEQPKMIAEGFHNSVGQTKIKAESAYNLLLKKRPRIDLGGTSGKNSFNKLVRPAQKLVKLITKTSNKVHKFKTYDKVINI